MKNLLKFTVIILVSLLYLQANAQSFGLKGGLNLATMLAKDDDDTYSDDYKMNAGFHIGAVADVPISNIVSFEPGLILSKKGVKMEVNEDEYKLDAKLNLYYLDIPLNFKISGNVGNDVKIYIAAGPYIGIGLSGKVKATFEYGDEKENDEIDVEWGSEDDDHYKRLDFGLTFGGGVQIQSFLIGASYDLGLSNISSYQENGATIKNRVLKFSVGYFF